MIEKIPRNSGDGEICGVMNLLFETFGIIVVEDICNFSMWNCAPSLIETNKVIEPCNFSH